MDVFQKMSWIVGQLIGSTKSLRTESLTNPKIADTTPPDAPARAAGRISWANEAGVRKEKHGGTMFNYTTSSTAQGGGGSFKNRNL